jgi:hypothetical protein
VRRKNIFCSLTFWGILLSYLNAAIPTIKMASTSGFDLDFTLTMLETTVIFAMSVLGRYNAEAMVYTPRSLPGRNK